MTIDESRCTNNGGAASVAIAKVTAAILDAFDRFLIVDVMPRRMLSVKVEPPGDDDDDGE